MLLLKDRCDICPRVACSIGFHLVQHLFLIEATPSSRIIVTTFNKEGPMDLEVIKTILRMVEKRRRFELEKI